MSSASTVKVTPEIEKVVHKVIGVALEFEELVGRKLGVSANVGELLVAKELNLRLVRSDNAQGYDALDTSMKRVEIKVRRSEGGRGRSLPPDNSFTSRFSEHPYHYALLATMTRDYRLHEIYRATRRNIEAALKGKKKRVLSIGKFKRIGRRVYP